MATIEETLANNLADVQAQIAAAAERSGRQAADVTLVAVTKYVDAEVTRALAKAGSCALGESRPQSLWQKAETLTDLAVDWHMIGHLQRNKIRRTLPLVSCIHSVDSERLLDSLQQEAERVADQVAILLEVNIAGDPEKTGFLPEQVASLAPRLDQWDQLQVCGLMAMSGRMSKPDQARREFAAVRQLRDRMQKDCPDETELRQLSMGMSGDFALAIQEGATIVRIGSALFEGIDR